VNCRVLPEDSIEYVKSTLEKVIADDQVKLTIPGEVPRGPASPMRPDIMKAVGRLTDTMWPGVPSIPMMVMGATDGRSLRLAGIPTYGIQGFFMDTNDMRMHGRDERMNVKAFYEGQQFLYALVKTLSSGN
jgi:acetylornithine deacetylase/succinyl-diaminopimelate desuccinylase-like protein